jgi:hypothetical protein
VRNEAKNEKGKREKQRWKIREGRGNGFLHAL